MAALTAFPHASALAAVKRLNKKVVSHVKVLNTQAQPAILITQIRHSITDKNLNFYKRGDKTIPAEDLSPLERGHTYKVQVVADRAIMSLPFRTFDSESSQLVTGLTSYARIPPSSALIDSFSLDYADYRVFTERVEETGCLLIGAVSLATLKELSTELETLLPQLGKELNDLDTTLKGVAATRDHYKIAITLSTRLDALDTTHEKLTGGLTHLRLLNQTSKDPELAAEIASLQLVSHVLQNDKSGYLQRLTQILTHVETSVKNSLKSQMAPRGLDQMLSEIQQTYPLFNKISTFVIPSDFPDEPVTHGLLLRIGNGKLFLYPDNTISVEGNLDILGAASTGKVADVESLPEAGDLLDLGRFADLTLEEEDGG